MTRMPFVAVALLCAVMASGLSAQGTLETDGPAEREPARATAPDGPDLPLDKASGVGSGIPVSLPTEDVPLRRDRAWLTAVGGSFGRADFSAGASGRRGVDDFYATFDFVRRDGHTAGASWLGGNARVALAGPGGRGWSVGARHEERGLFGSPGLPTLQSTEWAATGYSAVDGTGRYLWFDAAWVEQELAEMQDGSIIVSAGFSRESGDAVLDLQAQGENGVYLASGTVRWSRTLTVRSGLWLGGGGIVWREVDDLSIGAWPTLGAWWKSAGATWTLEVDGDMRLDGVRSTMGPDAIPTIPGGDPHVIVEPVAVTLAWERDDGFRVTAQAGVRHGDVEWLPNPELSGTWLRHGRDSHFREIELAWLGDQWRTEHRWSFVDAVGEEMPLSLVAGRSWSSSLDGRSGDFRAGGTIRGASATPSAESEDIPAWWTLDLRGGWAWTPQWEVSLAIDNVLGSQWSRWSGYDEPGITGWVGIGRQWDWTR